MICDHAGVLAESDPLYGFLAERVWAEILDLDGFHPVFDRYHLDHNDTVLRYTERASGVSVVGKFWGNKWIDGRRSGERKRRAELMQQELDKLRLLRDLGFGEPPRRVVRPLAVAPRLNLLLVAEWAPGTDLDDSIRRTVESGSPEPLLRQVEEVAAFLAELHQRTAGATAVDPLQGLGYLDRILHELAAWGVLPEESRRGLEELAAAWRSYGVLATGRQVLTHGDAIPPHFLFDPAAGMTCIDVERLSTADRAADLGCVAAELKHLFLLYGGDPWAGEPFIRRLWATYFERLPGGVEDFSVLTARGRFFMGCYLLRIARNAWLDLGYRHGLIAEARRCLHL